MKSPERNSTKTASNEQVKVDSQLNPLAVQVQDIITKSDTKKQISDKVANPAEQRREQLLSSVLDHSLTPEKRLAAAKSLVGNQGHIDVNLRDSKGQMHKLRLEVESAGNSRQLIHVFELHGGKDKNGLKNERNFVLLRGVSQADGSFCQQKNKDGEPVSFAPDKLGKVEVLRNVLNRSDDGQIKASEKISGLNQQSSENKHLGKIEISGGHRAVGTAYYPHNSALEGGYKDKIGKPLNTLEDYLAGKAPFVSVAMDDRAGFKYGQRIRIPELEQKYGKQIPFKIVDTGGAFRGKGTGRIDICVANEEASRNATINGKLTLQFV